MAPTAGPAILLLHGQPGGARDWKRVIAELSARVTPIAIDRPGWDGHSRPQDLAGNARAALASLDARGASLEWFARWLTFPVAGPWVVTGSADRVVPASAPQALARQILGARLIVRDGAGHLLPQLHARRLSTTILSAAGGSGSRIL